MTPWTLPRLTLVLPNMSAATTALAHLGRAVETAATAFRKAIHNAFRHDVGSGYDPEDAEDAERADWQAFQSHQRHLRGLLEQDLLLRSRRLGPSPSALVPRRRPCMPRRRERRRRATRDG